MRTTLTKRLKSQRGFTILELLIAGMITSVIAVTGFEFYTHMHDSTKAQQEVVDAQLICRNSLQELKKSFRMAGYRVGTHPSYYLSSDTFAVYYQDANPIDSITYYLEEIDDDEYSEKPELPTGVRLYQLYKQTNSGDPALFSDNIISLQVRAIDAANLEISIAAITSLPDAEWNVNNGYRTVTLTERVKIRNL